MKSKAFLATLVLCSTPLTNFALGAEGEVKARNPLIGGKAGIKTDEPAEDAKWEPAWQKLCSYDDFCNRLKNTKDSSWYNPRQIPIEIMKYYRDDILKAAKLYNVDPRAIVGSFLADLTIIPVHEGEIHRFLVDKATGKNVNASFPLGLVYPVAALPVEDLAAKIEKRKPRPPKEVRDLLDTPVGTIYYGAAVIRDAQDRYLKHGFDISKRIDVLATLYNLGKVDAKLKALEDRIKRAKEMKAKGATDEDLVKAGLPPEMLGPRFNFFGFFTQKNADIIDEILTPSKDSRKPTSGEKVCQPEKTAALAEYSVLQGIAKEFANGASKKVDDFAKAMNKKISNPDLKNEDFEKAFQGANAANPICPSDSNPHQNKSGDFYCSFKKKTSGIDTYDTYSIRLYRSGSDVDQADPKPPQLEVCYFEQVDLAKNAAARFQSCALRDVGDQASPPDVETAAYRISGAETFYGREEIMIPSDPDRYVSYAIPLDCYYIPASPAGTEAKDVRAQGSTQSKAQNGQASTAPEQPSPAAATSGETAK